MVVKASAPGKLMLFGEHAVVYGYPCIVTAVDLRYLASIAQQERQEISIETPAMRKNGQWFSVSVEQIHVQSEFPRAVAFVLAAVKHFYSRFSISDGLRIWTDGPEVSYGLGSSSAITVAVVTALARLNQVALSDRELFEIATEAVLDVQGKGSGFDVAAAVFGGTLFFEQGESLILPLNLEELPLVIGFSGDKVSTTNLINQVRSLKERHPKHVKQIFDLIGGIVHQSRDFLEGGDWAQLGDLVNLNQGLLEALGVSTLQLTKQIFAARKAGAFGAKLSGAGGGDCMFALVDDANKGIVSTEIENMGGTIVPVKTGVEGVRIEQES